MAVNPFENISSNYVKNPLGILALFIVLIYGLAGAVAVSKAFTSWHLSVFAARGDDSRRGGDQSRLFAGRPPKDFA